MQSAEIVGEDYYVDRQNERDRPCAETGPAQQLYGPDLRRFVTSTFILVGSFAALSLLPDSNAGRNSPRRGNWADQTKGLPCEDF
jgi:hypothetical protein